MKAPLAFLPLVALANHKRLIPGCETNVGAKRSPLVHVMILASALLLWGMTSCGRPQSDIVGKWSTARDSSAMVWEFSQDGSVLKGSTQGKYSFGDQNRIKIQTPFGTSVYQMELTKDRMVLRDPTGSKLEFTRIK